MILEPSRSRSSWQLLTPSVVVTNPNDPISLAEDILVDSDGLDNGSCFGFTQKFVFDWPDLTSQPGEALNAVIGRRPDGEIISQQRSKAENATETTLPILPD